MCRSWNGDFIFPRYVTYRMSRDSNSTESYQNYSLDIEKEDLPEAFIDRLEHVDEKGMVGNIQLWTGARRNTATSFVYKGLTVIYMTVMVLLYQI